MRLLCKILTVAGFLCALPGIAAADADGGTQPNLSLGAGSRGIALGGAFLADVRDASAVYWNPAALGTLLRANLSFMHAPIGFGEASQTYVALAYPTLHAGSFGVGLMRLGTGGIQAFDAQSRPLGEIDYSETALYFSYAHTPALGRLGRNFSLGATLKTLTQRISPWSSTGVGVDLGLRYEIERLPGLATAIVFQDLLAPRLELDQAADELPTTVQLAASLHLPIGTHSDVALHVGAARQGPLGWVSGAGVEYRYRRLLSLRVGRSRDGLALGVGFGWDDYSFDYAFLSRTGEATHPVSFGAGFGSSLPQRLSALEAARHSEREAEVRSRLEAMLEEHLAQAQEAYDLGDYKTALEEWKLVAGLDPANTHAARGMQSASARLAEAEARSMADRSAAAARAAQFEIALRYYGDGEYTLARNVWQKLLEQDPDDVSVRDYLEKTEERLRSKVRQHAARARDLEKGRDWVSALTEWNLVLTLDPLYPEAEPGLARCRAAVDEMRSRSTPEPVHSATTPTPHQPTRTPTAHERYRKALSLYSANDVGAAVELLREALELDPGLPEARELLARAERRLRPLSEEEKEEIRRIYLRGMDYFMAEKFEKSIEEWSKILSLDPENESAYRNIDEARARLKAHRSERGE